MNAKSEAGRGGPRSSRRTQDWKMRREENQTQIVRFPAPLSKKSLIQRIQGIEERPSHEGTIAVPETAKLAGKEKAHGTSTDKKQTRTKPVQPTHTRTSKSAYARVQSKSHQSDRSTPWRFAQDGSPSANWQAPTDFRARSHHRLRELDSHKQEEHERATSAPPQMLGQRRVLNQVLPDAALAVVKINIPYSVFHSQYPWMAQVESHGSEQHAEPGRCERCLGRCHNKSSCRRVGGGFIVLEKVHNCNATPVELRAKTLIGKINRKGQHSRVLADGSVLNHDGSQTLPDGTRVLADGTVLNPDGSVAPSRKLADGTIMLADGTIVHPDGSRTSMATLPNVADALADEEFGGFRAKEPIRAEDPPTRDLHPTTRTNSKTPGSSPGEAWVEEPPMLGAASTGTHGAVNSPHRTVDEDASSWEDKPKGTRGVISKDEAGSEQVAVGVGAPEADVPSEDNFFVEKQQKKKKKKKKKSNRNQEMPEALDLGIATSGTASAEEDDDVESMLQADPAALADTAGPAYPIKRRSSRRIRRTPEPSSESSEDETEESACDMDAHLKYSILSEEKRGHYKQVFRDIDINGDGSLSIEELQVTLADQNEGWSDSATPSAEDHVFVQTLLSVSSEAVEDGLDFKTFCIVLALSVWNFDGPYFGAGNKTGPEAMNAKVEVAQDLFQMLEPDGHGNVRMDQVRYALMAGNTTPDVIDGIARQEVGGIINFMDVLTYLPLFAENHSHAKKADSIF